MTGLVGGVAPGLKSTLPISGGGGLTDIAIRSTQAGVPEATILRAMGPSPAIPASVSSSPTPPCSGP